MADESTSLVSGSLHSNVLATSSSSLSMLRRRALVGFGLIAIGGGLLPSVVALPLFLSLLTQATIAGVLATSVGFLIRQSGLVSFGQAAYFGLAGYLLALLLAADLASGELALVLGLLLPTVLAFGFGLILIRMIGVTFSMLTLAIAQGFYELFMSWRGLANGEDGMRVPLPDAIFRIPMTYFQDPSTMFVICWAILVTVVFALWFLTSGHFGALSMAIRENEERVRFLGYPTVFPRVLVYTISAFIAALAGCLFALYNGFVTPQILYWALSGEAIMMAIVGGTRFVWGPALGAMFFFFLKAGVGDLTVHWPAMMGTLLIFVVLVAPGGLSGGLVSIRRVFRGSHG